MHITIQKEEEYRSARGAQCLPNGKFLIAQAEIPILSSLHAEASPIQNSILWDE